jgi:peptide/nickel transport system substrate-binding protein
MRRLAMAVLLATLPAGARSLTAQQPSGTIIIAVPAEASAPVPTLYSNDASNRELGDLLFLRLAEPGPTLRTSDEKSYEPRLAKSWHRRDPLTLVFELDPRARWHDGVPVTAADVVFTINRGRDRANDVQLAGLLRHITSVEADGDHRVIFHFDQSYPEQLYDATYHLPPLPAHLVDTIAPAAMAQSAFAANPVGNGPYRWVRRARDQRLIELAADTTFFLGRPGIRRVIFEGVSDPEARANMLRSGAADAIDNVYQLGNPAQLLSLADYQSVPFPSLLVGYLLFNTRDPSDTTRLHPILQDIEIRRAVTEALDREALARTAFGPTGVAPPGPVSQALWVFDRKLGRYPFDPASARKRLLARGWSDHDGDGIADKDGQPLRLNLVFVSTSAPRRRVAEQAQEMLRQVGIDLQLLALERAEIVDRRNSGRFDLDFGAAVQDPTPSGLTQTWSCAGRGGSNYGRYCDPAVDSLMDQAITSRDPAPIWRKALIRIAEDAPAVWAYTPTSVAIVHRRFEQVSFRPQSSWLDLWRWRLKPGAALPRDTEGGH